MRSFQATEKYSKNWFNLIDKQFELSIVCYQNQLIFRYTSSLMSSVSACLLRSKNCILIFCFLFQFQFATSSNVSIDANESATQSNGCGCITKFNAIIITVNVKFTDAVQQFATDAIFTVFRRYTATTWAIAGRKPGQCGRFRFVGLSNEFSIF